MGLVVWVGLWVWQDMAPSWTELGLRLMSWAPTVDAVALTSGNESGGWEEKTAGVDALEHEEGK